MTRWIALVLACVLVPVGARAQVREREPLTARGAAMAGSVVATGTGMDAVVLNPASIPVIRSYVVDLAYGWRDSHIFGVAVTDSITNGAVYASAYYLRDTAGGGSYRTGVAIGGMASNAVSVGINGYWGSVETEDGSTVTSPSFDAGVMVRLNSILVGGVIYDVVGEYHDKISYGVGAAFLPSPQLAVEADVTVKGTDATYRGGAEFLLQRSFAVRGGVSYDASEKAWLASAGFAAISPQASLEVAVQKDFSEDGDGGWLLYAGLRFFMR